MGVKSQVENEPSLGNKNFGMSSFRAGASFMVLNSVLINYETSE